MQPIVSGRIAKIVAPKDRRSAREAPPIGPPMPQNLEAERSVLGAILLDNNACNAAVENLRPEDFFLPEHQRMFTQMIEMRERQQAIDLVTLTEQLQRKGELEASGGAPYLASLADGMPRVSNVRHYGRIVKEKAILRNLIHTTDDIQRRALHGEDDAETVLDDAGRAIASITNHGTKKSTVAVYTPDELAALVSDAIDFVVFPFAARGMLALLDGAAKAAGKTTLLLTGAGASRRQQLFLNHATKQVAILIVTEENPRTIRLALERAGLVGLDDVYVIPFTSIAGQCWPETHKQIEKVAVERGIGWVIVDTFYAIAGLGGDEENKAGAVDEAIVPLRRMAGSLDIAVTITRHTRKAGGQVGESGRGSTALTGAADIIAELKRLPGNQSLERRSLEVTGRIEQARFEIELREGKYIIIDGSAEKSGDEVELLEQAIVANPTASIRQLWKATGIGRNRVPKLAAKSGWLYADSGWKRNVT